MNRLRIWPWLVVAAVAVVTLILGYQLRTIRIEGGFVFLPQASPVEQEIARMEKTFGSSEVISIMMHQAKGTVFTVDSLETIARITSELEVIPGITDVQSLSNSDYLQGDSRGIVVGPLVPKGEITAGVAEEVRKRARSWEMYQGLFFSADQKSTQWIVTLASGREAAATHSATIDAIRAMVSKYATPSRSFMVSGDPAVKALLVSGVAKDIMLQLPALLLILIGILFFAFWTPVGVLLPLSTVVISTVWTMGLMASFGIPLNLIGTAIPLLLVTVGSAYGIHFLSHYFDELSSPAGSSGCGPLSLTVRRVGLPILLAGITTMAGFGSLGSASVPAILHMGIFTAVGILATLVLTFSLVPALLTIIYRRPHSRRSPATEDDPSSKRSRRRKPSALPESSRGGRVAHLLTKIYDLFAQRPILLLAGVALLVGFSAVEISRIRVGQPTINFFRRYSPIRTAARFADENFGGSTIMYVLIRPTERRGGPVSSTSEKALQTDGAPKKQPGPGRSTSSSADPFGSFGDLSSLAQQKPPVTSNQISLTGPRSLAAIQGLAEELHRAHPDGVGRVSSIVALIEEMNRVMHDGSSVYYEIPASPSKYHLTNQDSLRRLISQYLLLYSGNLNSFLDRSDDPTELRVVVQLTDSNPAFLGKVKEEVASYSHEHLRPLGFAATTVGLPDEMLAMNASVMRSQITSLSIALICVFLALWIAYRSVRVGLAGLIPIALSLALNFAAMGLLHIPLDIVTAIVASIAIGIGIDYSIHVISAYVYEYRLTRDTELAAHATLALTGRAIFFNVASVALGFAVLIFSMFTPMNTVGILMGLIMLTSSFFSLTLLPVVLRAIVPRLEAGSSRKKLDATSGDQPPHSVVWRNK